MEPHTRGAVVEPSTGGVGADIRNTLGNFLNAIKRVVKAVFGTTFNGPVLSLHYRWTFCFLLCNLLLVWLSWYYSVGITCTSMFNSETQVRLDFLNICINYPFVEAGESRRYLLYYRWMFLVMLVVVGVYYIPRKAFKSFDNPRCKKLMKDLRANARCSDQTEKELMEQAAGYMTFNLNTHNGLYWKSLGANIVSLVIDIVVMKFLDFILHGRFFNYGFESFPFIRDPQTFTDYMSQTFPPFVNCEVNGEYNKLVNKRIERYGCHLTNMELYDKLFLGLWLWLIVLILITCCYIVFLLCMLVPFLQAHFLCTAKPAHVRDNVREVNKTVAQNCKVGDIYVLYRLKGHLSNARFYELLTTLSETSLFKNQVSQRVPVSPKDGVEMLPPSDQDTLQNTPNAPQDSTMNVEVMALEPYPQHSDEKTLLHDKKADILCV